MHDFNTQYSLFTLLCSYVVKHRYSDDICDNSRRPIRLVGSKSHNQNNDLEVFCIPSCLNSKMRFMLFSTKLLNVFKDLKFVKYRKGEGHIKYISEFISSLLCLGGKDMLVFLFVSVTFI